jgi:hypothetical protein
MNLSPGFRVYRKHCSTPCHFTAVSILSTTDIRTSNNTFPIFIDLYQVFIDSPFRSRHFWVFIESVVAQAGARGRLEVGAGMIVKNDPPIMTLCPKSFYVATIISRSGKSHMS